MNHQLMNIMLSASPGYDVVHEYTKRMCDKAGISYDDVQTLEAINDPTTYILTARATMKSGEVKTFTVDGA